MICLTLACAILFGTVPALAADKKEARRTLHVLLFAGGPTREYQFLRMLLAQERDAGRVELSIHLQPPAGRKTAEAKSDAELRHGFFSYYPVQRIKAGAVVLAALADPKARLKGGEEQSFLVTMPAGEGRVIYLSSGEMWRLRQHRTGYHKRFWMALLAPTKTASCFSPLRFPVDSEHIVRYNLGR